MNMDSETPAPEIRPEHPARFFSSLTSLEEFDKLEIRNVIKGIVTPTQHEICYIANYHRAVANVGSILALNQVRHVQAIASTARGLFEIAVDVALINKIPNGPEKMLALIDVEKLRAAQAVVEFKAASPTAQDNPAIFQEFINLEGARITALRDSLWPNRPDVQHWSLLKMKKRTDLLGPPFDRIFAVEYPRLSWYVHSGLTGIANLPPGSFELMAGIAFTIAIESYMQIMGTMIDKFKLTKADPKIKTRMLFAKMAPWTDDQRQAFQLQQELGLI
jgi:hypothetical protein